MKNLRGLRNAKCISMKSLGEKIGVAESTISLYETGKREPDFCTLKKLSDYFGVSIDFLLNSDGREWDHESFYEDYAAEDDNGRLALVQKLGIAYRIASDYFRIIASIGNSPAHHHMGRTQQKGVSPSEDGLTQLLQEPYMKEIYEALSRLTPESRKLVLTQIQAVGAFESNAKK